MARDSNKPWYQKREFLWERRKWYEKLAKTGFVDVEYTDWNTGESGNLLQGITTAQMLRRGVPTTQEQQRYYELARQYLHSHSFTRLGRMVWKRHSEGIGTRDIAQQVGCSVFRAQSIIREHKKQLFEELSKEED